MSSDLISSEGALAEAPTSTTTGWPHRLAVLLLVGTFVLIFAGGHVTSKDAGMAVPDWPTSYNSLNPEGWTSDMGGTKPGVFAEHGHRVIGATIGFITLSLTLILLVTEKRLGVRRLGLVTLAAVVIQGIMGGLRVTEISITLAIFHGCFAHAFMCLVVALVAVTSRNWPGQAQPRNEQTTKAVRFWTIAIVVAVYGQLILGATLRHTQTSASWHILGAMGVGMILVMASQHVFHPQPLDKRSHMAMLLLFLLYALQIVLGLTTFVVLRPLDGGVARTLIQTYMPTVHVVVGALILAVSFDLAIRTRALTDTLVKRDMKTTKINEVMA